jgi:hypothetical protein
MRFLGWKICRSTLWKIPEIMSRSACDIKLQNRCNLAIEEFATDSLVGHAFHKKHAK